MKAVLEIKYMREIEKLKSELKEEKEKTAYYYFQSKQLSLIISYLKSKDINEINRKIGVIELRLEAYRRALEAFPNIFRTIPKGRQEELNGVS